MRVSSDRDDPGYIVWTTLRNPQGIRILLDGEEMANVITADEEKGEIVRALRDEQGLMQVMGDEIVYETLKGKVTIVLAENEEPKVRRIEDPK